MLFIYFIYIFVDFRFFYFPYFPSGDVILFFVAVVAGFWHSIVFFIACRLHYGISLCFSFRYVYMYILYIYIYMYIYMDFFAIRAFPGPLFDFSPHFSARL